MTKIIGNTTATPNPRPDWNQTDSTKADYIKNKPVVDQTYSAESENAQSGVAVSEALKVKQENLVSGVNIKTINGQDILGEGDIVINIPEEIEVDAELSDISENPVQNKVINAVITEANQALNSKQETLISGANIKTINGESVLGEGDITIEVPDITVDAELSDTSENPVQNKVVDAAIKNKTTVTVGGETVETFDADNKVSVVDMNNWVIQSLSLISGTTSGTILESEREFLTSSSVKTLTLDGDIYHLTVKNTENGVYIYECRTGNQTKTIEYTASTGEWVKTETVTPHLYSHYISINFSVPTTDQGSAGTGYVIINLITNSGEPFTKETFFDYVANTLNSDGRSGVNIVSSGRFLTDKNVGGAISSVYIGDKGALRTSIIYFDGMSFRDIYGNGIDYVTNNGFIDNVMKLI